MIERRPTDSNTEHNGDDISAQARTALPSITADMDNSAYTVEDKRGIGYIYYICIASCGKLYL